MFTKPLPKKWAMGLCTLAIASTASLSAAQQQTSDQQKCINTLNKEIAKIAKKRGQLDTRCIRDAARGLISDVDACRNDDSHPKLVTLFDKLALRDAAKCFAPLPDFGYTGAAAIIATTPEEARRYDHDIFGGEMNDVIIEKAVDPDGSKCQEKVHKTAIKLSETAFKEFNKCKKDGIKTGTILSSLDLQTCFDDLLTEIASPGSKMAGRADKVETQRSRCVADGVDLAAAFPACCDTSTSDCLVTNAMARVCRVLNAGDALNIDCSAVNVGHAARGMVELLGTPANYDVEHPASPTFAPGEAPGWMHYRWVPLCADGSGDHLWSLTGTSGTEPTCAPAQYIRCVDGTRPMYRIDHAVDGSQNDVTSYDWAFFYQGGGSCEESDGCWSKYTGGEYSEMTSVTENHARQGTGLMGFGPNNPAHDSHRVRIIKCAYDRYIGDRTALCSDDGFGNKFHLYRHGRRITEAVLNDLATGVGLHDESCAGTESDLCKTLTPLTEASQVVLAGHSGGGASLAQNIDWIAGTIQSMATGATPDVRGVFDEQFRPSLENEPAFENGFDANGDGHIDNTEAIGSAYDHDPNSPPSGFLPHAYGPGPNFFPSNTLTYSDTAYLPGGSGRDKVDSWGGHLDESCAAAHDDQLCYSPGHMMFNHIETPFFIRQAIRDSVDLGTPIGWSDNVAIGNNTPLWGQSSMSPTVRDFTWRVLHQIDDLVAGFGTLDEMTTGVDTSGAPTWSPAAFFTNTSNHVGVDDNTEFTDVCLMEMSTSNIYSYAELLGEWLASPATSTPRRLIHGQNAMTAPCP